MFKKLILTTALFASTVAIAFANPAPYVGASLGVNTNTDTNGNAGSFRGVPFNLFAGYGGIITQSFYLAGELMGTLTNANLTGVNGLKTTYGYSASIIPGLMLSDHTLAFVRAGVIRSHFTSVNTTRTGGQVGLGLQTNVTQHIDLRGEYDFTGYQAINRACLPRVTCSSSPRSDTFTAGLIYKFD